MSQIYGTKYRGTVEPYFIPKQSGVLTPDPRMPGDPCPCPDPLQQGIIGQLDDREWLPLSVIFFSNAASGAGSYRGSSNFIPWPFEIESLRVQESGGFGVSYLSYNLFLTEVFYNGQAGVITEPRLIDYLVNVMDGVPLDLQSPIGPYIRTGSGSSDNQVELFSKVRCPNGGNKRIGVGIKYTGAPGPNCFIAFNFLMHRIG